MSEEYEIHIRGRLPDETLRELAGLCAALSPEQTLLHAEVRDAVAMSGLRSRLQGLGIDVLESRRIAIPAPDEVSHDDLAFLEPLTLKETEVLGYLSELFSTEEIATSMYVSVNTVRTHIRSVLRKLGVSRRNAAVRRARQVGLLAPTSAPLTYVPSDETGSPTATPGTPGEDLTLPGEPGRDVVA